MLRHLLLAIFHGAKFIVEVCEQKGNKTQLALSGSTDQLALRGPERPFVYKVFAVEEYELGSFYQDHPDAIPAQSFLHTLRANGRYQAADEAALSARRVQSRNPGCEIVIADFQPARG